MEDPQVADDTDEVCVPRSLDGEDAILFLLGLDWVEFG